MDKTQKQTYMSDVETYLDSHNIYTKFEDLLKALIVERPEKPLEYLVRKIKTANCKLIQVC